MEAGDFSAQSLRQRRERRTYSVTAALLLFGFSTLRYSLPLTARR
jgi:hypothetical protein